VGVESAKDMEDKMSDTRSLARACVEDFKVSLSSIA
jgi:hypothetical protein